MGTVVFVTMVLFDDVGSYPLPQGISREWIQSAFKDPNQRDRLFEILQDAMRQKIDAGVIIPTYPQFQEMNEQFLGIITQEEDSEPFVVKNEKAKIIELEAMETVAKEYRDSTGERMKTRICVTGPIELHLKQLGSTIFGDILQNLARSVDRFVKNSIEDARDLEIYTLSIDEPSMGLNPDINIKRDDMVKALGIASASAKRSGIDVEIHLHSPICYKPMCEVDGIGVLGIESAANPHYLDVIDFSDLEGSDKFIRVGVSRTDIYAMAAQYNDEKNIDVWKDVNSIEGMINHFNSSDTVLKRLKKAYDTFGDRIKYAGPDCGIGTWPSQKSAFTLLEYTGRGIREFNI
ncbi:MAG: methionine synthase [Halobacteriota archaeon]|nr:methionine synthase [Halobacteriota archaeon]